jgi:adenylate cyclase
LALKAIALDPDDGRAYAVLAEIYLRLSDMDRALDAIEHAYTLNPNDPFVLVFYGRMLTFVGRAKEGVEMINRAYRLNPHYPDWYNDFVDPFYDTGQYDRVIAIVRRKVGEVPIWVQLVLVMSYAQLGRQADTAVATAGLLGRYPDFSMERAISEFGTIKDQSTLAHYLDGARKAALQECATPAELQKYPTIKHLATCDAERGTH